MSWKDDIKKLFIVKECPGGGKDWYHIDSNKRMSEIATDNYAIVDHVIDSMIRLHSQIENNNLCELSKEVRAQYIFIEYYIDILESIREDIESFESALLDVNVHDESNRINDMEEIMDEYVDYIVPKMSIVADINYFAYGGVKRLVDIYIKKGDKK